jgi:hypothetical protein
MFNLNSKEVIRLQTMNEALKQQKMGLQSENNRLQIQKAEIVDMIEKFDYFKDNVYTLLREIQRKLNS